MTPWTIALQISLSMGFSRQEYWGGLPFPSPGDLPNLRMEHRCPALQADSLPTELQGKPGMVEVLKIIPQVQLSYLILIQELGLITRKAERIDDPDCPREPKVKRTQSEESPSYPSREDRVASR